MTEAATEPRFKPKQTLREIQSLQDQAWGAFDRDCLAEAYGYLKQAKEKLDALCEAL